MRKAHILRTASILISISLPFVFAPSALAATGDVSSVQNFIRSIIQVVAGIAGLVATGFFVVGGFSYITSSGNPEHLDKAKRTLLYSATGLAITIAAFVISNIVTDLATNAFGK
jgi:TRAP-type C4-dicarboxylate transport system permease small subunit